MGLLMKKLILLVFTFLFFLPSIGTCQYLNLSNDSGESSEPQIIADVNGNINVVWMDYTPGNWDIFYAVYSVSGWSSTYNISSTPTNSIHPRMAVDSNGWVNIVWEEDTPSKEDIISARFNPLQSMKIYKDTLTAQIDSSSILPDIAIVNNIPVACWLTVNGQYYAKLYCAKLDIVKQQWAAPNIIDDSASTNNSLCRITSGNDGTIIYMDGGRFHDGSLHYAMRITTGCIEQGIISNKVYGNLGSAPDFEVLTNESGNGIVRKNLCGVDVKYDSLILMYHDIPCTCMWDSPVECVVFDGNNWSDPNIVINPRTEEGDYSKISFTLLDGNRIIMACNRQDSLRTSIRTKIFNDSSWQNLNFLPNNNFTSPSLTCNKDGEVWAAMCSESKIDTASDIVVYHSNITSINRKVENILPIKFGLLQNYPNPFNPTTTIRYQIPKQSQVTIKIFDVLGKEVAALLNAVQKAGAHEVEWNAKDFASGVYFYQIRAGEFIAIKKMLLIK